MNWQDILAILVPLISLIGWGYHRLDKRFESLDKRFESIDKKFDSIDRKFELLMQELKAIREDIHKLDVRLTRLEGRFDERGYWESREWKKTGTEEK